MYNSNRTTSLLSILTLLNDSMEVVKKVADNDSIDKKMLSKANTLIAQYKEQCFESEEVIFSRVAD